MFLVAVSVDLSRLITLLPRLALHFAGCLSERSKRSPAGKHMESGSEGVLTLCLCEAAVCFLFKVHRKEMDGGMDANDADANSVLLNGRGVLADWACCRVEATPDLMHEAFSDLILNYCDKTTQHNVTLFLVSAIAASDFTYFHFFSSSGVCPRLFTPLGGITTSSTGNHSWHE